MAQAQRQIRITVWPSAPCLGTLDNYPYSRKGKDGKGQIVTEILAAATSFSDYQKKDEEKKKLKIIVLAAQLKIFSSD